MLTSTTLRSDSASLDNSRLNSTTSRSLEVDLNSLEVFRVWLNYIEIAIIFLNCIEVIRGRPQMYGGP